MSENVEAAVGMERSRKLALIDRTQANNALHQYFVGNKSQLADHLGMSRTTVTAFFKQQLVREAEFRKICLALRLKWEDVSAIKATSPQSEGAAVEPTVSQANNNFEALVQQVREHCRQKILSQHSQMRLLSGEEIGVNQLYVDVWLLNRSPRTFQVSQDRLLQTFDLRNDRLGLGDRIQRNQGFEIANANAKLVILGKPGAGKTTFLKHLAVDWYKGKFQPDLIAVVIELRRIRNKRWTLVNAIGEELGLEDPKQIEAFLKRSKLLVLMDGLDEVTTNERRRNVQDQLREMAKKYVNNRWILTCRTQIIASIPDGFTSVEVADFNPGQVQQFVQNWFQASGQSNVAALQQWEDFDNAVSKNLALKELTVTPVLLSLMCLVFHDEGEMPSQMTDLYKRGIRLLLEKWNDAKAIEGWEVGSETYRQLSVEQKELLLIEIAARKFENPENFVLFKQEEVVAHIDEFLQSAYFTKRIARLLHLNDSRESIMVLKAMEAQHGLLIERADELWSFSHLTFQEHFTVQWLTQLPSAQLAEKIANLRWQQVVDQLVKSQQPADRLLRLIKQSIDRSISGEPRLNQLLTWVLQKAGSIRTDDKPVVLRACYFALARDRDLALAFDLALTLAHALAHNLARDRDRALVRDLARTLANALDLVHDLAHARARALDLAQSLDLYRALDQALTIVHDLAHARALDLARNLNEAQGQQWLEHLRQEMIKHRNVGYNWQFNEQQQQQLQRYYDANCFLVNLMQIQGAVSKEVRAEIEDTLLLPWDELQRRQPDVYGQTQPTSPSPVRVFIAYSQEDEDLREGLDRHLAGLRREGKIQAWDRGAIEAGAEWDAAIKQQLETAQIILLLISANFIASNDCYDLLRQALQRHSVGTARVVPIILKPTDLQNSPFSHLSSLPTNGVPITLWNNRDEAFLNVVKGIRGAIESLVS